MFLGGGDREDILKMDSTGDLLYTYIIYIFIYIYICYRKDEMD